MSDPVKSAPDTREELTVGQFVKEHATLLVWAGVTGASVMLVALMVCLMGSEPAP